MAGDNRTATDIDRKVGLRVRARRLEIGMSQERLAELLGITFQQVQKYEGGKNRIAVSRLIDIADALNVPAAKLLEGEQPGLCEKHADEISASIATPEGARMAHLFARVKSRPLRQQLLRLAAAVAEDAP